MIKLRKLLALVLAGTLAFSMSVTAFAETAEPAEETAEAEAEEEAAEEEGAAGGTVVYATSTFGQKFSPFFYTTAYDAEVVELFTGYTLASDRGGAIVENGI